MTKVLHLNRYKYLLHGRRLHGMDADFLKDCLTGIKIKKDKEDLTHFDVEIFAWITEELLLRREK